MFAELTGAYIQLERIEPNGPSEALATTVFHISANQTGSISYKYALLSALSITGMRRKNPAADVSDGFRSRATAAVQAASVQPTFALAKSESLLQHDEAGLD